MTINLLIFVCLLAGVLFVLAAMRQMLRRRPVSGVFSGALALALFLAAAAVALLAADLRTYQRLGFEQSAAELQFSRQGDRPADKQFNVVLTYPTGASETFLLRGDEWQIDGRVIKWHALANVLGFDTAFRLERLGGRFANIDDERARPRTVYALNPPERVDLWNLARRYKSVFPGLDALYGSAAYLPMADGALYEVRVSQSGLVARPLNQAARDAVGGWH
jgi:hypothetical protein